MKRATIKL